MLWIAPRSSRRQGTPLALGLGRGSKSQSDTGWRRSSFAGRRCRPGTLPAPSPLLGKRHLQGRPRSRCWTSRTRRDKRSPPGTAHTCPLRSSTRADRRTTPCWASPPAMLTLLGTSTGPLRCSRCWQGIARTGSYKMHSHWRTCRPTTRGLSMNWTGRGSLRLRRTDSRNWPDTGLRFRRRSTSQQGTVKRSH